jgi:hypothetical protein
VRHKSLTDGCVRRYTINFGGGIALDEKFEPRGAQGDRGNRGASEEGLQEPYSAWPFGFARGRTPLLAEF